MDARKHITTKSGYKTNLDRYSIHFDGHRQHTTWGITKARTYAREKGKGLFGGYQGKIEIVNEYTGEVTRVQ